MQKMGFIWLISLLRGRRVGLNLAVGVVIEGERVLVVVAEVYRLGAIVVERRRERLGRAFAAGASGEDVSVLHIVR